MSGEISNETFEDVEWEEDTSLSAALSRSDLGLIATLIVLVGLFLYDYLLAGDSATITFPFTWDFTQLDWLFLLTLACIGLYVVLPLWNNKRLTAYYWREFRKNRLAVVSIFYLLVIALVGLVGPVFLDRPELAMTSQYQPPVFMSVQTSVPIQCTGDVTNGMCYGTWKHPLGTTSQGKDILLLVIYGMEVSMKIGLIVSLLVITIGTAVGTVAAYAGGLVDEVLMRYVDIQQTFPAFFLYLMLIYLYGGSLFLFIIIFGFFGWEGIARLVRSEALQRTEEEYIKAADSAGASTFYIIRRHLVPNVSNTIITATTLLIPGFILFEASLSFLSLGDPTVPSWGQVIAAGRNDLRTAWWVSTFPGFFLFFTILAFNFVGDALGDAIDPRRGD